MEPMESCVPPGFRFHPTDEELVGYYLKKKVASQSIDRNVIKDINLYRIEPSDIQERCRIGYAEQNEWYFFSHKDKKYPTGTRTNRATMTGFWKATGRDKAIFRNTTLIGMRKTLVFYKGRAPSGQKSDWIMHEYRLQTHQNAPPQEEGWVVCRAFRKRSTNVNRKASNQACDSSSSNYNLHEETISGLSSSSAHHRPINLPNLVPSSSSHGFLCKQELDHNTATTMMMMMNNINNILYTDPQTQRFLQLPQLECPSPILPVLPYQNNNNSKNNRKDESDIIIEHIDHNSQRVSPVEKVTDWRALDKFVASQLSYDDNEQRDHRRPKHNDQGAVHSSFGGHDNNEHGLLDMALLLLQNNGKDGGEGDKFINGILHI